MQTQDQPPASPARTQVVSAPNPLEEKPHGLYRIGHAYGQVVYKLRWLIVILWIAGLAVSVPFAAKVGSVLTGGGYSLNNSESVHVGEVIADKLGAPPTQVIAVFQSQSVAVSDPGYQREVRSFATQAQTFPHVVGVTPAPAPGKDGKTTFITLSFDTNSNAVQKLLPDLQKLVPSGAHAGPARVYLTGDPAVYGEFSHLSQQDTEHAELAGLPVALVVLLVVFGTLLAAVLPLLLAAVAVPVALAVIYGIAVHTEMSIFVLNVASIVGLGISIDYSLFMTRRFREELARGRTPREAVAWTISTAGEAILFSGLTVMIGFTGMLLIGMPFMTSFGVGGAVVVAASVTAALTLLPALLGILGPRINALRIPLLGRLVGGAGKSHEESERPGFWHALALGVMRRPLSILIAVSALLLAIGWPVLQMNVGTPDASSLPTSSTARQGLDILTAAYPASARQQVLVLAQTPDGSPVLTAAHLAQVEALTRRLGAEAHVTAVTSVTQPPATPGKASPSMRQLTTLYTTGTYTRVPELAALVAHTTSGDTTLLTVSTDTTLDSSAGKQLITRLRADEQGAPQGLNVSIGGLQATSFDFNSYLYGNFPKAILFILVATYVLLLLMFRSALLPLKAILMNALSVGAAYGAMVFIFQQGHFERVLGFTANGTLDSIVPILLFCILFGLSMDYEVFLLSRMREEWQRTRNNRYAVARGLEKTGGVITSAALLFVIVTGAFTFTSLILTKEIGLGMTVAVLVDATIIRTLLVPATMRLLGRWNWWLPGLPVPVERNEGI